MNFSFSREAKISAYTDIENAFITEYLPLASGEAVKVYIYGLFLCANNKEISLEEFAKTLDLTEDAVKQHLTLWEDYGLISVNLKDGFFVEYLPVRSSYGAKPRKYKAEKYADFTKTVQAIIPTRMISTSEYTEYFNIMETYSIKPEAMLMIIKYCVMLKGDDIGYKYISKVAKDFGEREINTAKKVEEELSSYSLRTSEIQSVLKALSLKRSPEIDDLNLYKKWTRELNFEPENIIFAASKLKKASMEKLDGFLLDLYSMKSFSKEDISAYMDNKKKVYDIAIRINHALSIYMDIIDTVVDTYTKRWLSYGFTGETLVFIANHCFKEGKNTLQYMDELVEELYKKGSVDLTSVSDYFESTQKADAFIKKMLLASGVNRRPTDWDRQNLATWKSWNFTEDMILRAAELASGKTSPIPYMVGVLSNWKRDNVFTLNEAETSNEKEISQEEYNLEYANRRNFAVSKAQRNLEKAMLIEEFPAVYGRLNSIEKDLAFAEIAKNTELLEKLETEKTMLILKAESLLKTEKLSLSDLTPTYACEKCRDTGYVGTKRCDCFVKEN